MTLIVSASHDDSGHVGVDHPECPARTRVAMAGVYDLHLGEDLVVASSRQATHGELTRVHDPLYLENLRTWCSNGGGDLDPDTYATSQSFTIATTSAGNGLEVVDELRRRGEGIGFVVSRPPGHHARVRHAMGFCLINNVAVAAANLADAGERVAIIDWDVHHGNGTQEIFWDRRDVLYASTHQWPLYPGTGAARDVGGTKGNGTTVNVPLPAGATGDVFLAAFEEVIAPEIEKFQPTFLLVSAGFDAHRADPLAQLELTSGDFARLARLIREFAPSPGRLALFLEGGYNLDALQHCVTATLSTLLGATHASERPSSGGPGRDTLRRTALERLAGVTQLHETSTGRQPNT